MNLNEAGIAQILARWRDRILSQAATKIEGHFYDRPTEDLTAEEKGFERGLRQAVTDICSFMDDPSYFGRDKAKR